MNDFIKLYSTSYFICCQKFIIFICNTFLHSFCSLCSNCTEHMNVMIPRMGKGAWFFRVI
jgi:hypothetical protein